MGVPLQLILGVLLVLGTCSLAEARNLRQIREAPPPPPAPTQNVTEINNRDLNKIVNVNSKTEALNSKSKIVNNINNVEEFFPIKLGKSDEEPQKNVEIAHKNETKQEKDSKEDEKKDDSVTKMKEKLREENARAIDIDASKFWSSEFHSKNNVFTLSPMPSIATIRTTENPYEGTRHPSFDDSAELTTPTTKLFDHKFKETVESVEQKLDDIELDNEEQDSEEEDENNDEHISVDDLLNKRPANSSLEFEKSKTIVINETIDKNSIQKDLKTKQTKKVIFENIYNETKGHDDTTNKGDGEVGNTVNVDDKNETASSTTALPMLTTRKSSLLKELVGERSTSQLLSNNIETESVDPVKGVSTTLASTSTISSTIPKIKGELDNIKVILIPKECLRISKTLHQTLSIPYCPKIMITTFSPSTHEPKSDSVATSTLSTTTVTILPSLLRTNISDQENIIPLQLGTERIPTKQTFSEGTTTPVNPKQKEILQKEIKTVLEGVIVDITTETVPPTTDIPETTTDILTTINVLSDDTTTFLPEEGTTIFVVENSTEISSMTTETPTIPTTVMLVASTSDNGIRTSKSMTSSIVTEQMIKTSERNVETSTKVVDARTESTIRNELDSTTLNNGKIEDLENISNVIQKVRDIEIATTEETTTITTTIVANQEITTLNSTSEIVVESNTTTEKTSELSKTTLTEVNLTSSTTEEVLKINTTTELPNTTIKEKQLSPTTEFTFVHIENTANKHTTLLPEILSPNLNYSTSVAPESEENKSRQVVLNNTTSEESSLSSSSPTVNITSEEPFSNVTITTENPTETSPTENSFTKDGEGDGSNKGKIAAIAISCVGAVCLVILAGLLYVMKKRQRRLNYGPRCRPVSLDDYSIDNLSVYNSVRRKGGARMSKRSFGNPAFDDPVAPTHPLNFPALAKFSTNYDDIKAEFEEIPQITARTSELPDGCDTRNRYANVIPLPETRVYLNLIDGYPNSDYINANYVTGPKNVKGYYIATQGPMLNTVDDFWRMVWEQQSKVILMLTHLVENGLEKCADYLPESEVLECSRLFGDFQITLKKREVKEKYIISSLQLKNMVSNSWREVTHFWYLGWPEKGVPSEANSLIAFLIEARSYMKTVTIDKRDCFNGIQNGGSHNEHNPVVVHCSPGTGRTGVAIACDIAIREFETSRLIDIPKIVYRIRRDRANAIQTKEQYMFIYKVVSLYATKLTGGALENL